MDIQKLHEALAEIEQQRRKLDDAERSIKGALLGDSAATSNATSRDLAPSRRRSPTRLRLEARAILTMLFRCSLRMEGQ